METTKTGTFLVDGIEFNEYPPPQSVIKAMKRVFAIQLRDHGILRMHNLAYYRKWENEALGDTNDGRGLFRVNGRPYSTGSANPLYASCLSLPTITPNRLVYLATLGEYDCVVIINNTEEFLKRMRRWKASQKPKWWLHSGLVKYNRGTEVSIDTLNDQKFHHNVFQKDPSYSDDLEYRISLMDTDTNPYEHDFVDVSLGECSDIVTVDGLPNRVKDGV